MPHCCVPQCRNRSETNPQLSFYRFPANPETKRKWMIMIQRDDFCPTPNTRVCSWHFPNGKEKGPLRFHWTENNEEQKKEPAKIKKSRKHGGALKCQTKVDTPLDLLASAASVMEAIGPSKSVKSVGTQVNRSTKTLKRAGTDGKKDNLHAYAKKLVVTNESRVGSSTNFTDITFWHV